MAFLKFVLNSFNSISALFQSKKPLIHEIYSKSRKLFLKVGQNFIKPENLNTDENVRNPHIYVQLEDLYLGQQRNNILLLHILG